MALRGEEAELLRGLAAGGTLKVHRTLDGSKNFRLHPLVGEPVAVAAATVAALKRRRLVESNKKFPAATYLLTSQGRTVAARLVGTEPQIVAAENF